MNNLLWCPIDIPKFPIENFRVPSEFNWNFWNVTKLTEERSSPYEQTTLSDEISTQYPELVEWLKNFPYLTIRNLKFNIQIGTVAKHIDFTRPKLEPQLYKNNSENEPCGYRILLHGSRSHKLYVVRNGVKHYVTIPDSTDTYVLGHTNVLHGVEEDQDRITIFTHFEIDSAKHKQLLEKSIQKYSEYAVFA